MTELYFSTDVETDGPIPGPHSMLSYASAAFLPDGKMVGTFSHNLETLEGASMHPSTQIFWNENPVAYQATRENIQSPHVSLKEYVTWVKKISYDNYAKPVFVAYPAGFDFTFMYWYMMKFAGECPFSFSALDMKSYAMAKLGINFRDVRKKNFPKAWKVNHPHTHLAIDDAIEQGEIFMKMLRS